jgi:hypothetical protein
MTNVNFKNCSETVEDCRQKIAAGNQMRAVPSWGETAGDRQVPTFLILIFSISFSRPLMASGFARVMILYI